VVLGHQDDTAIAQLMTRSNIVITGCGGGSMMENMEINHPPGQQIFIYHPDAPMASEDFKSGILWELHNAEWLINWSLTKTNLSVQKISPRFAKSRIEGIPLEEELEYVTVEKIDLTEETDHISITP
jgi:hypothetical protein